jgi:hypothetical protein
MEEHGLEFSSNQVHLLAKRCCVACNEYIEETQGKFIEERHKRYISTGNYCSDCTSRATRLLDLRTSLETAQDNLVKVLNGELYKLSKTDENDVEQQELEEGLSESVCLEKRKQFTIDKIHALRNGYEEEKYQAKYYTELDLSLLTVDNDV